MYLLRNENLSVKRARSMVRALVVLIMTMLGAVVPGMAPGSTQVVAQPGKQIIFSGGLEPGWEDWSWDSTVDFEDRDTIHGGIRAIRVQYNAPWAALRLHSLAPLNGSDYLSLQFRIHGGTAGGQQVRVVLYDANDRPVNSQRFVSPIAGRWLSFDIPMRELGSPATFVGIAWQDSRGTPQPAFYLDDVILISAANNPPTRTLRSPATLLPTPTSRTVSTLVAVRPTGTPAIRAIPPLTSTPTDVNAIPPTATPRRSTLLPTPTSRSAAVVSTRVVTNGPRLVVDANTGRYPISPFIYGMNFADEELATELRLPVRRWGGNATTRYNWKLDTMNRAKDYFFENIPNENDFPGQLPNGSASDKFVEQDRITGTRSLITIPMIGWVPKSRDFACGFSVAKYGAQQQAGAFRRDCGNGVRPNGTRIVGNDPRDTSAPIDPAFVQEWIQHLSARFGTAEEGGVTFYGLDNEPMLWSTTHRDVHPEPLGYDELRDLTYRYGAAIKAADPTAQTVGPSEWGWTNYFYSAKDLTPDGKIARNPPDRLAHGNLPLAAWYLREMRAYEQRYGHRILDYFDLHFYPQAPGIALHEAGSQETQALRLRSTRALWDPRYRDESWIGDTVRLIPRMREWIAQYYPGTRLAITEYNWGGLEHINGALAQADILGIFGRERVDLAALWEPPKANQPGAFAFRMYLNYDGAGGRFGDTSVGAGSADQSKLAIYASVRTDTDGTDSALLLMIINKTDKPLTSEILLRNFSAAPRVDVYRYSSANLTSIVRQPGLDLGSAATRFVAAFPGESITLLIIPTAR